MGIPVHNTLRKETPQYSTLLKKTSVGRVVLDRRFPLRTGRAGVLVGPAELLAAGVVDRSEAAPRQGPERCARLGSQDTTAAVVYVHD